MQNLTPFYRGWEEYQRLLIDAIAPLSPEQLALAVAPGQRPIWLIAAHIIGTRVALSRVTWKVSSLVAPLSNGFVQSPLK